MRQLIFIMAAMLLTACANDVTIVTGKVQDAIAMDEVELLFGKNPACDFEEVAWMQFPGNYFNQESIINSFRHEAAELGASAVQIIDLQKMDTSEYRGSARALRCKPA